VHQGDQSEGGEKGVYHINAVDQVTQWQVVGSTPRISEAYLEPVLEHMLHQFPFRILGFHTDNGSEFINRMVARLLDKLRIEQTKSRPRQSGDNGLVETKNGAIIRKHIGYGYIDAGHADTINSFYREYLNPYKVLSHLPCLNVGLRAMPRERRQSQDRTTRIGAALAAIHAAARAGLEELDRLALAEARFRRRCQKLKSNAGLPPSRNSCSPGRSSPRDDRPASERQRPRRARHGAGARAARTDRPHEVRAWEYSLPKMRGLAKAGAGPKTRRRRP